MRGRGDSVIQPSCSSLRRQTRTFLMERNGHVDEQPLSLYFQSSTVVGTREHPLLIVEEDMMSDSLAKEPADSETDELIR